MARLLLRVTSTWGRRRVVAAAWDRVWLVAMLAMIGLSPILFDLAG